MSKSAYIIISILESWKIIDNTLEFEDAIDIYNSLGNDYYPPFFLPLRKDSVFIKQGDEQATIKGK